MSRLATTFKAFSYRDYRLLWFGAFASSIGTWMQKVAQSWLILTMTGSAFLLGLDAFLGDFPFLAFSLVGGVLADRIDRRRILLLSQVVQMSAATLLASWLFFGKVPIALILSLSFVTGLAQAFGGPAYQALVPTLVPKDDMANAVALNSIQFNLARVVGPVLAGFAFAGLGAVGCFSLNALSFLAPIAALLVMRMGAIEARPGEKVLTSLRAGLDAVFSSPPLRGLVGLAFVGSFCAYPLVTFLPVFARDVFGMGAQGYSTFLAVFGVGAVVGALVVAFLSKIERRGLVVVSMLFVYGILSTAFSLSRVLALSYVLLFFCGVALIFCVASLMTLMQTNVEDSLRGRVVSVYTLAFRGAMPLGNLMAGVLTTQLQAPFVLALNGVLLTLVTTTVLARRGKNGVLSL